MQCQKSTNMGKVLMTWIIMAIVRTYLLVGDNFNLLDYRWKEYMSEAHRYWQFSNNMWQWGAILSCQATLIWFVTPTFYTAQNIFLINFLKPDISFKTRYTVMSPFTAGRPKNRGVIGRRGKKFKSSPKCSYCLRHPPALHYTVPGGKVVRA
jgi:hypothetical protein